MKSSFVGLRKSVVILWAAGMAWSVMATAPGAWGQEPAEEPQWRTWTSTEGAQIEAYLREVRDGEIVIIRRDGKEFVAPLERFSAEDQQFVAEFLRQQIPSAQEFRAMDFTQVQLPDRARIDGVSHVRQQNRDPVGTAALQMVLDFHGVSYAETLNEQLRAVEARRDQLIAPRDLQNVVELLPVETEVVQYAEAPVGERRANAEAWTATVNAIRTAIHLGLPVIITYHTVEDIDSPATAVVAVGYDQRRFDVIDPAGSRSSFTLDIRDLELLFAYGLVVFPTAEAAAGLAQDEHEPAREFLSAVSTGIREAPEFTPGGVTTALNEQGLRAQIRDVNREDLRGSLGQTRSFARAGGIGFIDTALQNGNVVIVPQEFNGRENPGFLLIYGQSEEQYQAVAFFPDRQFRREPVEASDIARRWLTRENRAYRLDLIEVPIPPPPEEDESEQSSTGRTREQSRRQPETEQ